MHPHAALHKHNVTLSFTLTSRKEHTSLSEELQHLKDSLLRDTNRGIDQQRVIDQMKAERRETICMQAQQRQELEKDLHNAEAKVKCVVTT